MLDVTLRYTFSRLSPIYSQCSLRPHSASYQPPRLPAPGFPAASLHNASGRGWAAECSPRSLFSQDRVGWVYGLVSGEVKLLENLTYKLQPYSSRAKFWRAHSSDSVKTVVWFCPACLCVWPDHPTFLRLRCTSDRFIQKYLPWDSERTLDPAGSFGCRSAWAQDRSVRIDTAPPSAPSAQPVAGVGTLGFRPLP